MNETKINTLREGNTYESCLLALLRTSGSALGAQDVAEVLKSMVAPHTRLFCCRERRLYPYTTMSATVSPAKARRLLHSFRDSLYQAPAAVRH